MKICNNILEAIGNTPMVRLNKIIGDTPATVLAKVETFNPGNSIKDRMALKMIEDAEKAGLSLVDLNGDYNLSAFDELESPRMIFIWAKK